MGFGVPWIRTQAPPWVGSGLRAHGLWPHSRAGRSLSRAPDSPGMVVAVRLGLMERHGKVRTPEGTFEVHRGDDGWYTLAGPSPAASGRLRYDDDRALLEIEREAIHLSIQFRPETERTTFEFGGRTYDVAPMDFGEITIKEGTRVAVQGHATLSGARLKTVDRALQPIESELAFGLALRSSALDEDFWHEDHPLVWGAEESAEDERLRHEEKELK